MLKRILRATGALLFGQVIGRLSSLILVPVFLRQWSATAYGEYLAMTAAVAYLATLDIGVQLAALNRLTKAYVRREREDYRTYQSSAIAMYAALALLGTAVLLGGLYLLPVAKLLGLKATAPPTARTVMLLLGLYLLWSLPTRVIFGIYQTIGDLARSRWIANLQQLASTIFTIVVLLLGGGMIAITLVAIVTFLASLLYTLADIHWRIPDLMPRISGVRRRAVMDLVHPSLMFGAIMVANLLLYQANVLLVSATLGGIAVAVFSVSRTLVVTIRDLMFSTGEAFWPELARMEGLSETGKLRTMHRLISALSIGAATALAVCVFYEGASIITVWTHGRLQPDVVLLRLLALYAALQTVWAASSTVLTATNRHRTYAIGYFAAAVIAIAISAGLMHWIGVWAIPIAWMAGEAIGCYHFVIRSACRLTGEPYGEYARRVWPGFVMMAAAALGAGWATHTLLQNHYFLLRWAAMGAATLLTSLPMAWLLLLDAADRAIVWPRIRPLLAHRQSAA